MECVDGGLTVVTRYPHGFDRHKAIGLRFVLAEPDSCSDKLAFRGPGRLRYPFGDSSDDPASVIASSVWSILATPRPTFGSYLIRKMFPAPGDP